MENKIDWKKERSRLKSKAHQIFFTSNPVTKESASRMIMALMISRKSPSVKIVTGNVKITNMGFTMKFNKLKTMATIIAVMYESTKMPFRSFERITTARALNKILRIIFIVHRLFNIKKGSHKAAFKLHNYFV